MLKNNKIILFDGICNFCNSSVNFIIDRDIYDVFRFSSLQSDAGNKMLHKYKVEDGIDSLILIEGDNYYTKSTAALKIAKELKSPWKIFYIFIIIPKFVRDFFYDIIAKNRYRWFGKREKCRIPTEEEKNKFIL